MTVPSQLSLVLLVAGIATCLGSPKEASLCVSSVFANCVADTKCVWSSRTHTCLELSFIADPAPFPGDNDPTPHELKTVVSRWKGTDDTTWSGVTRDGLDVYQWRGQSIAPENEDMAVPEQRDVVCQHGALKRWVSGLEKGVGITPEGVSRSGLSRLFFSLMVFKVYLNKKYIHKQPYKQPYRYLGQHGVQLHRWPGRLDLRRLFRGQRLLGQWHAPSSRCLFLL